MGGNERDYVRFLFGTAFSEAKLLRLASGFEHVAAARSIPKFLESID
jgi:hypothetical protein